MLFERGSRCGRCSCKVTSARSEVLRVFVRKHADGQQLLRGLWWPRKPIGVVSAAVCHSPVNGGAGDGQQQNRARCHQYYVFERGPTSQRRLRIIRPGVFRVRPATCATTARITRPAHVTIIRY